MLEKTISIKLPEMVLYKLQKAAELTYRSLDEVLASTVDAALTAPSNLPLELAGELAAMHLFSDDALWAAMQPSFSSAEQTRLQQINHAGGERPLSPAETAEQSALLNSYHRSMLRRAQAMAILKQRRYNPTPETITS